MLACCLLDPASVKTCFNELKYDGKLAFYDLRHQTVYAALLEMFLDGKPIDLITVSQHLKERKLLNEIGGIAYLSKLQDATPSAANLPYYLGVVREKSSLRKLIQTCTGIVRRVYDHQGDVDILRDEIEQDLHGAFEIKKESLHPEIVCADKFTVNEIEPPTEVIHGILHRGSKMALGGASKSFKTWSLLDVAISVSTGADWLQFHTTPGKVLFLNFEIPDFSWQSRLKRVAKEKQVTLNENLQLWNLRGYAQDFRQLIPIITDRCRGENYLLIVLDPIYKIYGNTDENSARDTAELLNSLERLATESGAAIAFGAHFAKGNAAGKNAIDRISGSGVFARDPDSILVFTEHESESAFTIEPILRNFPRVPAFSVRWNFPLMAMAEDLNPEKLKQAGVKKKFSEAELLKIIIDRDETNPVTITEWAELANVKRTTLSDYLTELRNRNFIKSVGEGKKAKIIITNDGKGFVTKII